MAWSSAVAAAAQVAIAIMTHWNMLPELMVKVLGAGDALSYVLYLIGGGVVAFHLAEADVWVRRHARLIVALTVVAALAAEGIYFLARHGVTTVLGSGSDPFQPSVIPFNVGAITCGYLAGVALVRPWRSRRTKALVRVGSDDSYGLYLVPDAVHHHAQLTGLGTPRLGAAVAGGLPAGRGDRLHLRDRAHRPAGPDATGGAAHRAQAGAMVDADTGPQARRGGASGPGPGFTTQVPSDQAPTADQPENRHGGLARAQAGRRGGAPEPATSRP